MEHLIINLNVKIFIEFYIRIKNSRIVNVLRFKDKNILKLFKSKFQTQNFLQNYIYSRDRSFFRTPDHFSPYQTEN